MSVKVRQDSSISWHMPQMHNLRFMKAQYIKHSFRPHSHDYWVIGLVETGLQTFRYEKEQLVTPPGKLIIINPGEVHTGEAAISEGFMYRAFYPTVELMQMIAQEFSSQSSHAPIFHGGLIDNKMLYHRIRRLHYYSEQFSSSLQIEEDFMAFFIDLFHYHAKGGYILPNYKHAPKEIILVREYIEAHFDQNITLTQLSELTHISPFHLSRLFKRYMNVSPHRYLENTRIKHAEQMLKNGLPIVDVASYTGFSSQSHLTRTFKNYLGVTPGSFIKSSKIV